MKRIPSNEPKRSRVSTTSAAPNGVNANTIAGLRQAAARCKACHLWKNATQTVFGEGAPNARIMFVGEQPGELRRPSCQRIESRPERGNTAVFEQPLKKDPTLRIGRLYGDQKQFRPKVR
jgi:hypothetical protein